MSFQPVTCIGRGLLAFVFAAACAAPCGAQTDDAVFSSWRWAPQVLGSRPMGGAFVAVADGVMAAYSNPAGLTLIPVREVHLASGEPWLAAGIGTRHVRLAGYATRSDDESSGPGASRGSQDFSLREAGLAVGVQPLTRFRLGVGLAWNQLQLDDLTSASPPGGAGASVASVTSDSVRFRLTVGVLALLVGHDARSLPSLRMGISYQPGFDWSGRIQGGRTIGNSAIDIRRPSLFRAGLAWRPSNRWGVSAQGDLIRYSEVVDSLRRNVGDAAAAGFRLRDTVEPRLGAEFGAPLWCGCGVVKVRGGIHYRSPGRLRYQGSDPAAARAFSGGRWKTVGSVGSSFFTEHFANAIRLDLDAKNLFDGTELSFGIVWRF